MTPQQFMDAMYFFGAPNVPENSDFATILAAYSRALGQYEGDVLETAADILLRRRKHRNFPLLAECLQACSDARDELALRRKDAQPKRPKIEVEWTEERIKQADRMMNSDMGRLAAREGWIIAAARLVPGEREIAGTLLKAERVRGSGTRKRKPNARKCRLRPEWRSQGLRLAATSEGRWNLNALSWLGLLWEGNRRDENRMDGRWFAGVQQPKATS